MPARHDILCGALDFLWKPWGSIELWEESITATLRRAGVTTMLVSDHPHLFETGGENYHTDFSAWDYVRGHEGDPWHTAADPSAYGMPSTQPGVPGAVDGGWFIRERFGIDDTDVGRRHYDDSRTWFRAEDDFPGPRTMRDGRVVAARPGGRPRPVDAVRRRVRPARAVRHARAVGVDVRRRAVGRRPVDLAAVHRRRHRRRAR